MFSQSCFSAKWKRLSKKDFSGKKKVFLPHLHRFDPKLTLALIRKSYENVNCPMVSVNFRQHLFQFFTHS